MNGKDIFLGLRYIDSDLIEEAEFGTFSSEAAKEERLTRKKRRLFRRPLLAAAIIALSLLLAGCGIVYVLHMQDLKLGEQKVNRERWDNQSHTIYEETVSKQTLTMSGLKGSPSYQAAQEWYDFMQSYDPDHKIIVSLMASDSVPEFSKKYSFYNPYSQEMVDKIDEICDKYDLQLMGEPVRGQSIKALQQYLGMETVLLPDAAATASYDTVSYYEGGYFRTDFDIRMNEGEDVWPFQSLMGYLYSPKGSFNHTLFQLEGDDWQERPYTTASGHDVLILRSPTVWESWVFCDVGDATVTIRMETIDQVLTDEHGYQEVIETHMTDAQLNQILDTIDFDWKPQPGDPKLLEGQASSSNLSQTQNGYTVTVKKAVSDGYCTKVLLGVAAPEGTDLEQYLGEDRFYTGDFSFSHCTFTSPSVYTPEFGTGGNRAIPDNDGKANTIDYIVYFSETPKEGIPYPEGGVCQMFLQDIEVAAWNEGLSQMETLMALEGIWNFDITLTDGSWKEVQFVREAVTTKASTGFDMDGKDVFEDVNLTSLTLRAFGGDYTTDHEGGALDFVDYRNDKYPVLTMKDGSTLRLSNGFEPYWETLQEQDAHFLDQIPLDEIDYLTLMDGTKLYPVT